MKRHIEGVFWALSIGTLFVAGFATSRLFLLTLAIVWVSSTVIVIPCHFCRAWKRWAVVSNKAEYAVWVSFETAATIALISLGIYSVLSR
jgi:hypothetical protein